MASQLQWRLILERSIDGWREKDQVAERMLMHVCRRLSDLDSCDPEESNTVQMFRKPNDLPDDIQ